MLTSHGSYLQPRRSSARQRHSQLSGLLRSPSLARLCRRCRDEDCGAGQASDRGVPAV
jgi:hypothetical protein